MKLTYLLNIGQLLFPENETFYVGDRSKILYFYVYYYVIILYDKDSCCWKFSWW